MKRSALWILSFLFSALALVAGVPQETELDAAWAHFESWVRTAPAYTERPSRPLQEIYVGRLMADGFQRETAERRANLILKETPPRDRKRALLYWDAMFKFGGGPDRPLGILAEAIRSSSPGSALDVSMGNGRNSVYLASLGWKVTGYDVSPEALTLARERADRSNTTFNIVQASHREFDFGEERWDLVVLSYIVVDSGDLESIFGDTLWRSLKPSGRIVCEGNFCEPLVARLFLLKPRGFRLEQYSDSEAVRDAWVANDMAGRVIRAIIRKLP
jgi:2-polyprenyl-3-methyl-5-hydroxy-6-metoxy-1,4-benzoquinol methylase